MRADAVEVRLRRFLEGLECDVVVLDQQDWHATYAGSTHRFGYAPPVMDNERPLVRICPSLLDGITAPLDDDEWDVYLLAVEALVAAHLMLPDLTPTEAMQWVENELLADAPLALRLMSDVEMRAIDHGLATPNM